MRTMYIAYIVRTLPRAVSTLLWTELCVGMCVCVCVCAWIHECIYIYISLNIHIHTCILIKRAHGRAHHKKTPHGVFLGLFFWWRVGLCRSVNKKVWIGKSLGLNSKKKLLNYSALSPAADLIPTCTSWWLCAKTCYWSKLSYAFLTTPR